jgi:type IV pilus assembly protein PilW
MGGIPSEIQAMVGNTATVDNNLGCRVNDVALLINGTTCAMTTVTAVSSSPNYRSISLQSATAVGVLGANLACLGAWTQFEYKVNNGNLERNGLPIVSGIVNIQAQYGISTAANSNHIEQWVDATGSTWAAPSVTDRNRIKGVRIAVVARNGQYEKTNVTEACSSITDSSPSGLCAWDATSASPNVASPAPVIDLSNVADWQRYRYKTYETIVPLRNMIWATKETL